MSTIEERFWAKVDHAGGCWEWTASTNSLGYGTFHVGGKMKKAHRVSYEIANGPIPDGMVIDHQCQNRGCVNPSHLRLATQKQNGENLSAGRINNVTSGVRGVYQTKGGKWQARVKHHRKVYNAGSHDTIAEAEAAVIAKRNELYTHNDADRRGL